MSLTAVGLAVQTFAAVSVTNVTCRQRYPWNGLVDIDYTVVADDPDADVYVMAIGNDHATGSMMSMRTLSGDGADSAVKPGRHRLTWNAKVDAPRFRTQDFVVRMTPFVGAAPYLVVDLANGQNGGDLPFRYSTRPPDLSDDACRTTEMWFRLVPAGTFIMGGQPDELGYDESSDRPIQVTLTDPFYIAVFECTYRQWELVTGTNVTHTGDGRPINTIYNYLRGAELGSLWPKSELVDDDSFLGVFRRRTHLQADLPTSAQWEYACRAGTTTALNNGHTITDEKTCPYVNEVARYAGTLYDGKGGFVGLTTVGQYKPNNWGIYDMHGNALEWCRDWYGMPSASVVTNPVGGANHPHRVLRSGMCSYQAVNMRAYQRDGAGPDGSQRNGNQIRYVSAGFRLMLKLPGSIAR